MNKITNNYFKRNMGILNILKSTKDEIVISKKDICKILNEIEKTYKELILNKFPQSNSRFFREEDILNWKDNIKSFIEEKFMNEKITYNKDLLFSKDGVIQSKKDLNKEYKNKTDLNEDYYLENDYQNKIILKNNYSNEMNLNNDVQNKIKINNNYQNKISLKEQSNINFKIDHDFFTSKDIEINYTKIINDFTEYSGNLNNDEDELENQTLGLFLKEIANISRLSFNESNKFLKLMYNEYEKLKIKNHSENKSIISSLEHFKEEFSSWVKKNNIIIEQKLEEYFKSNSKLILSFMNQKEPERKKYYNKLIKDLLILYFHCQLSFPSIEINFKKEENFDFNKMIDQAHNRGEKKVNFVIFPSLSSNGNYLKNGKQYVFTYNEKNKKKQFYFKDIKLYSLITNIYKIPNIKDKLSLNIIEEKYLIPNLNYEISDKIKQQYTFFIKNKINHEIQERSSESLIPIKEDEELIRCDYFLKSQLIISKKY